MRQNTNSLSLKPLGLVIIFVCVLGFPNIVAGQCEGGDCSDCDTLARISSSLPRLSVTDLRRGRFNVTAKLNRNSVEDEFRIAYLVNGKTIFSTNIPKPESLALAGGWKITPIKRTGNSALHVWFGYGAGGRVYCEFLIYSTVESDGKSSWHYKVLPQKTYEPNRISRTGSRTDGAAQQDWVSFWAAFRNAVRRRDRITLRTMMPSRFLWGTNDYESQDQVFQDLDKKNGKLWRQLQIAVARGARHCKPPYCNLTQRPAYHTWLPLEALFELSTDGRWQWTGVLGD
jgi:hypothetical protein